MEKYLWEVAASGKAFGKVSNIIKYTSDCLNVVFVFHRFMEITVLKHFRVKKKKKEKKKKKKEKTKEKKGKKKEKKIEKNMKKTKMKKEKMMMKMQKMK